MKKYIIEFLILTVAAFIGASTAFYLFRIGVRLPF